MTEHYLHVQESIRQSAIQLFSEAFSAWKLDGTALIIASQLFKSLASTLARISQQMMLRSKKSTYPCDWPDKIFGIVVRIVVKPKLGRPVNEKNPTISNVKSLDLWSSRAGQIRTFSFYPISRQSVLKSDDLGAILVVERD